MSPSPAIWRPPLILILFTALVAACSSLAGHEALGCSGPRRPANPHGSVLAPAAGAITAPPAASAGPCRSRP